MTALTVNLNSMIELTDGQLHQLCQINRDVKLERTATEELILMPTAGGETLHLPVHPPGIQIRLLIAQVHSE